MTSKRIKLLVWTLVGAALATVVKMLVTDEWTSIRPLLTGLWDWLGSVGAWFSRPVSFPLWVFMLATLICACVIGVLAIAALIFKQDLWDAEAKLNPALPAIDDNASRVLTVIANNSGGDKELYVSELPKLVGMPHLFFEAAMDELESFGLFSVDFSGYGDHIRLTARGRQYILHRDFPYRDMLNAKR
jgi:hypothetical protein